MTQDPAPRLSVQSDLELAVGDLRATLVSDGTQLTLRAEDAVALARHAADVPGSVVQPPPLRELFGRAADTLNRAGLALRVEDDRGTIVELGDGCHSRVARIMLRTSHVRFGAAHVVAPTVAGYVLARSSVRQRIAVVAAGVALGVVVVATVVSRETRR